MNRALCIWLPEWSIQRISVARPELKSAPLVLHARDSRRGQLVMACCARAKQLGVTAGMPLAEVAALQKGSRQTSVGLEQYQPTLDIEALAELAVWCEQFSPIVGLENCEAPSCLLLDITGLSQLFGGEPQLLKLVVQTFKQRGYLVRVAAANTVGAAWALAHYGEDAANEELEPLTVQALRLPSETLSTLQQLGIDTISQLLQLPRQGLATRLGETLIKRIDQAFGQHPEVIEAHRPAPKFEAEWLLEHPTDRRDVIDEILSRLTEQVATALSKHNHAAVQVEAVLQGEKSSRSLPVSLFQPSSNPQHIHELFQLGLEASQMREPIQRVHVTAMTTVRMTGGQHALWEEVGQGSRREIASLVDRLSSRLGKENVFGIRTQAGALPELAYRKKPLTLKSVRKKFASPQSSLKTPSQGGRDQLQRPLWLHEPPQPLHMVASVMGQYDGPPGAFQFQNVQCEVKRYWGPERIETGWWRGPSVRRDYYRVETMDGSRFWIFRRLTDGAWFLHGCFE